MRYIVLCGRIYGREFAPNSEQAQFLDQLSHQLASLTQYQKIVGGYFNCIPNVDLDRPHPPLQTSPINKLAKRIMDWSLEWDLIDT